MADTFEDLFSQGFGIPFGIAEAPAGVLHLAGGGTRSTPTVIITGPDPVSTSSSVTGTWTWSSPTDKVQFSFRWRVLTSGDTELYSTGFIEGADVSYAIPYLFQSGSYILELTGSDGVDTHTDRSVLSVSLPTPADAGTEPSVGRVWEVAINGQGYMLADDLARPVRRQVGSLQAPRFATGDTPFSESVDRYTFIGQNDWSGGEGQTFGDRTRSQEDRYSTSEGVDVFGLDGGISLLPGTDNQGLANILGPTAVLGTSVFVLNNIGEIYIHEDGGSITADQTAGEKTSMGWICDITSDGTQVFALSYTLGIWYRTLAGSWTQLTASNYGSAAGTETQSLTWTGDRLTMRYENASGNGVVSTIAPDGTEEVSGGRFEFDSRQPHSPCSGDGYLFFAVGGDVYSWQLGSTDSRSLALTLPSGQEVYDLQFYLGNVIVYAVTVNTSNSTCHVYRALPQGGDLTPELVCEFDVVQEPLKKGAMSVGYGRLVLFAWPEMIENGTTDIPGVGAIDLSTGGYARWYSADVNGTWSTSGNGNVYGLYVRAGRAGFGVASEGLFERSSTLRTTGTLTGSVRDLGSNLTKVVDEVGLRWGALGSGEGVVAELSLDEGSTWYGLGAFTLAGTSTVTVSAGYETPSVLLRLTLTGGGSTSPTVRSTAVKVHPLTLTDDIIELPVNCGDRLVGLNGLELSDQVTPVERIRRLEALAGSRVLFQDVDWPVTDATVWEVVSVDTSSTGVYNRHKGHRTETSAVSLVTLRRGS